MTEAEFAALPEEMPVRELTYEVATPGFRVREVTLATTLLDAQAYPAEERAGHYCKRWRVEVNFRHKNITLNIYVLKCKNVDVVKKEAAMYAMAYDLLRSAMMESARVQRVDPGRVSLIDAIRWLTDPEGEGDAPILVVNPARPGRFEPRVRKRRPRKYPRMTKPRKEYRKQLLSKGLAA
jgi:hypothetical protein